MPTPPFILDLRQHVGHTLLWLPGATAVVVRAGDAGEEVLLVRRSDSGEWSPVCGIVDPGEEPHAAAIREVAEEAGVVAEVERLVWLSVTDVVTYANGDQSQYVDHTFRCRWVSGQPFPADGEASEARFFPASALPPMPDDFAARVAIALADEPETTLGRDPLRPRTPGTKNREQSQRGVPMSEAPQAVSDTPGGEAAEGREAARIQAEQAHQPSHPQQTADQHGLDDDTMSRLEQSS